MYCFIRKALKLFSPSIVLLATIGVLQAAPEQPAVESPAITLPKDRPCLLFLLGGQSNMDGCGRAGELPESFEAHPSNGVIWDNRSECWVALGTDSTTRRRGGQFGPELAFTHRLAAAHPDKTIAVMKTSAGGTKLARHWIPREKMYVRFIERFHKAVKNMEAGNVDYKVAGMLWMQGESDSETLEMAKAYRDNLKSMFNDVRQQTGRPDLPIVMGRISSSLLKKTPWVFDHAKIVQAAQEQVAADDENAELVLTDDLSTHRDNTHFDTEGQLELGRKMAEVMLKQL